MNKAEKRQIELNEQLAEKLNESRIKNLSITAIGNSIAAGFSRCRETKPLLKRNTTLEEILNKHGIKLETHTFARAQNNSDEHIYEWLIQDVSEREINKCVRNDYTLHKGSIEPGYINIFKKDEYFPTDTTKEISLNQIMNDKNNDSHIFIYSGATGSFLDNNTRGGKLSHKLVYGINRDITSIHSILKYIQSINRKNHSDNQVYIVGAPKFLHLPVTSVINNKLKNVAKEYANTTYVEPVCSRVFYKDIITGDNKCDIHYDEEEYTEFNNNILESIIKNFRVNKSMIEADNSFYAFNKCIDTENYNLIGNDEKLMWHINRILEREENKIKTIEEKKQFYKRIREYLLNRYPHDFNYLGKYNIKECVSKGIRYIKK